jgi:hypothetical protein
LANRDADAAAVLCPGDLVYMTTDAAASWTKPVEIPGALTVAPKGEDYVAAVTGHPGCLGVQLLVLAELEVTAIGCFEGKAPVGSLPGNVALSQGTETLWLWVGSDIARSDDEGATWTR